jgi:hypothetical protein
MPRRRSVNTAAQEPAASPVAVHTVAPTAVYFVDTFEQLFRLTRSTVRREVREGRLRIAKRAGRYYLLGEWILEWLRGGELPRRRAPPNGAAAGAPAAPGGAAGP